MRVNPNPSDDLITEYFGVAFNMLTGTLPLEMGNMSSLGKLLAVSKHPEFKLLRVCLIASVLVRISKYEVQQY